jgi:hypothetical protein
MSNSLEWMNLARSILGAMLILAPASVPYFYMATEAGWLAATVALSIAIGVSGLMLLGVYFLGWLDDE